MTNAHDPRTLEERLQWIADWSEPGIDLADAATYRGGWEQAWEWSKISDKVAALKSPT